MAVSTGSHPTTVRWCLGLQSLGLRPLTDSETTQLDRHGRIVLTRLLRLLVPIVGSPVALYGFALLFGDGLGAPTSWQRLVPALLPFIAGGFILPAAALLMARDVLREWRAIRADLRAGTIEQFRAIQAEEPQADDEAEDEAEEVEEVEEAEEPDEVEEEAASDERVRIESVDVVPSSRLVLLVNGLPAERPLAAQIYESAPPPGPVALYSLPAEIAEQLPEGAEGDGRIDRRRMTPEEVIELTSLARRLRRGTWVPLGVQAWVAAIGTAGVAGLLERQEVAAQWPSVVLFAFLVAIGIVGLRRMVNRWRLSRVIDEDRRDAWVLVLHGQSTGPSPIEILPRSQLLWSSASAPGSWRMTAVRGRGVSRPTA
jgi:hypothetical protein